MSFISFTMVIFKHVEVDTLEKNHNEDIQFFKNYVPIWNESKNILQQRWLNSKVDIPKEKEYFQ